MEHSLTRFVRVLRNAEVRVSPAETLDAARALEIAGYEDREHIRAVLSATLAKTVDEKAIFDECFDRYFSWHAPQNEQSEGSDGDEPAAGSFPIPADMQARAEDSQANEGELSALTQLLMQGDQTAIQMAIEAAGRAVGLDKMRIFTQGGLFSRRILDAMGWAAMQADVLALEQRPDDATPGHSEGVQLKQLGKQLREQVSQHVERSYLMYGSGEIRELRESVLRSARLTNIERRDLDRLRKMV